MHALGQRPPMRAAAPEDMPTACYELCHALRLPLFVTRVNQASGSPYECYCDAGKYPRYKRRPTCAYLYCRVCASPPQGQRSATCGLPSGFACRGMAWHGPKQDPNVCACTVASFERACVNTLLAVYAVLAHFCGDNGAGSGRCGLCSSPQHSKQPLVTQGCCFSAQETVMRWRTVTGTPWDVKWF